MRKNEKTPTEREWLIMEAVWDSEDKPTSAEILSRINKKAGMDTRTERVLLHHLCKKGLLGYDADERDSRVYHYFARRTREECLREKSREDALVPCVSVYCLSDFSGFTAPMLTSGEAPVRQICFLDGAEGDYTFGESLFMRLRDENPEVFWILFSAE